MMTTAAILLGVGSVLGGLVGWKLGRSYEKMRENKKEPKGKTPQKSR